MWLMPCLLTGNLDGSWMPIIEFKKPVILGRKSFEVSMSNLVNMTAR